VADGAVVTEVGHRDTCSRFPSPYAVLPRFHGDMAYPSRPASKPAETWGRAAIKAQGASVKITSCALLDLLPKTHSSGRWLLHHVCAADNGKRVC
jgi:hypothetical protein